MTYRDVVVCIDPAEKTAEVDLRLAVEQASRWRARLRVLDVSTLDDLGLAESGASDLLQEDLDIWARAAGVRHRVVRPGADLRDWLPHLHSADLIITAEGDRTENTKTLARILRESGVPVLRLPTRWRVAPVGRRVVLAWDASREAVRAAHDALPFLQQAERVVLFAFTSQAKTCQAMAERFVEHLGRHGVTIALDIWPDESGMSALDALFACLDRHEADLIVAGAFEHGAWLKDFQGGLTESLLAEPSVPVLLSH